MTGVVNNNLREELHRLQQEYEQDDVRREEIMTLARKALKPAKQAIYAAHRNDLNHARELLALAQDAISQANEKLARSGLGEVGMLNAALEEYIESACYISFVASKTIPTIEELQLPFNIKSDVYLQALGDCAGELARRAVVLATNQDKEGVKNIYDCLEELLALFMEFDFRSGELRKKTENIKYSLNKVEGIWYDLQVKGR